jgi:hypothetical protein
MKQSPHNRKLEHVLRSSKIVAGGFLGHDKRPLQEIIDTDLAALERLGYTPEQVARRMQQLTDAAVTGLGTEVVVEDNIVVYCEEWKGPIICPWPHGGRFVKRITTVRRTDTGRSLSWTDLNIHMIAQHQFFEGKGSTFRMESKELIEIIF